jgi:hypothetical protein
MMCAACGPDVTHEQAQGLSTQQAEDKVRAFLEMPSNYRGRADIRVDGITDGWCPKSDLRITHSYDARPVRTWIEFKVECATKKPFIVQIRWGDGTERYFVADQ